MDDRLTAFAEEPRLIIEPGRAARVAALAEPVLAGLGYRLVRVRVSGSAGLPFRSWPNGRTARWRSKTAGQPHARFRRCFDAADPIEGAYRLELSSPGIDRPLVRRSDFEALCRPCRPRRDGRRRSRGRLKRFRGVLARCRRRHMCRLRSERQPSTEKSPTYRCGSTTWPRRGSPLPMRSFRASLRRSKHGGKLEERIAEAPHRRQAGPSAGGDR